MEWLWVFGILVLIVVFLSIFFSFFFFVCFHKQINHPLIDNVLDPD